jgi:transcriptional regulator with XRE-family HTH domain
MAHRYHSRRGRLAGISTALRSQGLSWADIAFRVQQEEGVTPLVAFRLARGCTQRQIAEQWNSLFVGTDSFGAITDKQISYWEAWPRSGHEPSLRTLKRLARIFECNISELVEDGSYAHLDTARHLTTSRSEESSRTRTSTPDDPALADVLRLHCEENPREESLPDGDHAADRNEDEDMRRRSLLATSGALLLGLGVPQPRALEALQIISSNSPEGYDVTVESLSELVSHYEVLVSRSPSAIVYNDLLSIRRHAGSLVNGRISQQGDLAVLTGWLSSLLAISATDLGDHASALVWCTDTERRGYESRHFELVGWAALTKSLIAYYHRQAARSADIAVRGQEMTSFGTVVHARLAAQEMRARAMLKDTRGMMRAQRTASRSINALPADVQIVEGAFSIPLSDDPPYTATSLLLVGRYEEATSRTRHVIDTVYHQQPAVREIQPAKYSRSLLILGLAEAGLGRVKEAYEAGNLALDSSRPVWPTMVLAEQLLRVLNGKYSQNHHTLEYRRHYTDVSNSASRALALTAKTERDD